MPIARCCTATRRNCARCARLTGSKRCISVLRGAFWGKGWGTLALPHPPPPSPRKCYAPLSLSLSLTSSPAPPISSSAAPHPNGWSRRRSRATLSGRCFRPTYPNIPPPTPFHSSASLSLALSLARCFPHHRQPPLRRFASPTSRARMYPISRSFRLAFFLSFLLSLSFAQREVVFSSRDLSVQQRPLFAAPLLKGVKVLFVSFLLFFLYVMLEFWRDSERSK